MYLNGAYDMIGNTGPIIMAIMSIIMLWGKENLMFYYVVGLFLDSILNLVLKGLIKQPRPEEDPRLFSLALKNGRRFMFRNGKLHDIFGMPSGHSESALFTTIYMWFALRNTLITIVYALLSIVTMSQRVLYNHHTIAQVVVGGIVGALFGYIMYYMYGQKIKKDDIMEGKEAENVSRPPKLT